MSSIAIIHRQRATKNTLMNLFQQGSVVGGDQLPRNAFKLDGGEQRDDIDDFAARLGVDLQKSPGLRPLCAQLFDDRELPPDVVRERDHRGRLIYVDTSTGEYAARHPYEDRWRKRLADLVEEEYGSDC